MTNYMFDASICDMNTEIHPEIYMINQIIQDSITYNKFISEIENSKIKASDSRTNVLKVLNRSFGLSIYKLNQLYQYQLDHMAQPENTDKDPDYKPYEHTSFQPFERLTIGEQFSEKDDVEEDPDYVPSDSEEDSDSEEEEEVESDNDSSSDYVPSESDSDCDSEEEEVEVKQVKRHSVKRSPRSREQYESDDSDDEDYVPSDSEYDSEEFKSDEE